ncbi:MAG: saccharopine dehydrogenase NADP-binding domain-containing protein [Bdellovibrionaceae bacterium]|nr:saccharopine dehydrogenase NADP-binding domain-containing protein [Pseudobdellovibrionaceae bacterium]
MIDSVKDPRVLIVGGYGKVGLAITEYLVGCTGYRITLAGRHPEKGVAALRRFQSLAVVDSILFDVNSDKSDWDDTLKMFNIVITCIDTDQTNLVEACIKLGIHYLDVTANDVYHQQVEKLAARYDVRSTVLMSIGLAPGLTNLLAADVVRSSSADCVDISILLGSGENHGRAAIHWTIKELLNSAIQKRKNRIRKKFFGAELGTRMAFPFNFSDQYSLQRTQKNVMFQTRLSLDRSLLNFSILSIYKIPYLAKLLKLLSIDSLVDMLLLFKSESDVFSVLVEGFQKSASSKRVGIKVLRGYGEGKITGLVGALACMKVHEKQKNGIFHIHEFIKLEEIQADLLKAGCVFQE